MQLENAPLLDVSFVSLNIEGCFVAFAFYFARNNIQTNDEFRPPIKEANLKKLLSKLPPIKSISSPTLSKNVEKHYNMLLSLKQISTGNIKNPKEEYYVQWLQDGTLLMKDDQDNLVKVNSNGHQSDAPSPVFLANTQESWDLEHGHEILFDSQFSSLAVPFKQSNKKTAYKIFELKDKKGLFELSKPVTPCDQPVSIVEFNPASGSRDYVFVCNYNIFYIDPTQSASPLPITIGGHEYRRYGIADWLYEEEILGRYNPKALWWSESGKYLAYVVFDDQNVTKMHIPNYNKDKQYPIYEDQAYPKAGTDNPPGVFVWIWSKEHKTTQLILPPEELFSGRKPDGSYVFYWANWITLHKEFESSKEYLIVVWANRVQNKVAISICQNKLSCYTDIVIDFVMNGMEMWSEPTDFQINYHSDTGFFVILPHAHNNGDVYNWVAHIKITEDADGHVHSVITGQHGGAYDVSQITGYDRQRDELFFTTSGYIIAEEHKFRVPTASGADNVDPQCITCAMSDCKQSSAKFSADGSQFVLFCYKPFSHPVAYLKNTENILQNVLIRDDNKKQIASEQDAPEDSKIVVGTVNTSLGYEAQFKMFLPINFDPAKKYPVFLYVYGGPNTAQIAANLYNKDDHHVTVVIDGRGSSNRGWKLKAPMYKHFGGPEIDDQIEVMRYLIAKNSFMDAKKVVVSGWSYGGFATVQITARDGGETFRCGLAGGTVADFRFYDTAYTERYMGLPQENLKGYQFASLLNETRMDAFEKVKLLLAHGEADDNVHYQNAALLAGMLQDKGIHFTQLVYANQKHGIGGQKYWHLDAEQKRFMQENCFNDAD
uniref:Uncharacterized protein n=1 Tax=Ditylenchus dipsaci TaxID=166011 RepID=A0A915CL04_9BILA